MKYRSILALGPDSEQVAGELVAQAGDFSADLALLFSSHHHGPEFLELLTPLVKQLNVRNLIGCTGESIIGPDREVESQPAAVLWLAQLPNVRVMPFLLDQEDLQNFDSSEAWFDRLGMTPDDHPSFVVLADPFTFDILTCLNHMDAAFPSAAKVGGMASGADQPGQNRLFINDQPLRHGMVGVALSGPIQIDTVVSQGCRPVGKPYVVTKASVNIIEELGGKKPYEVLQKTFFDSTEDEKELMQRGLHVGVVIDETLKQFRPGDFLVHNLLGIHEGTNLAINNRIRPGQTIQFHVRDASTADDEMRSMLSTKCEELNTSPTGALLFTCNGRGRRLFSQSNHDIELVNETFNKCQVAGFFAQGEIGPVGGRSFVHGFTSSLILFQPQS